MPGRPPWSSLQEVIDDLRRTTGQLTAHRRRMLRVTGVAWSQDRLVRAVVGPRGHLLELDIDPRVFRRPDSAELSESIVDTVRDAVADAMRQTREIADETLPKGAAPGWPDELGNGAGLGLDELMDSHDADLRARVEEEDGHV